MSVVCIRGGKKQQIPERRASRIRKKTTKIRKSLDTLKNIRVGKDVISGRGEAIKKLNLHFRKKVHAHFRAYHCSRDDNEKRDIALEIYLRITTDGGRFLNSKGEDIGKPAAMHKIMKALKDANTRSGKDILAQCTYDQESISRTSVTRRSVSLDEEPANVENNDSDFDEILIWLSKGGHM